MIPLSILPLNLTISAFSLGSISLSAEIDLNNSLSTYNQSKSKSAIFLLLYFTFICFSTFLIPNPTYSWFKIASYLCFINILFIFLTARLSAHGRAFFSILVEFGGFIVALNALINLILHYGLFELLTLQIYNRFEPIYGVAPFHNINTGAYVYGLFFIIILAGREITNNLFSGYICSISAAILFFSVIVSQSRGVYIALAVVLILHAWMYTRNVYSFLKIVIGIPLVLVVALVLYGDFSIFEPVIKRGLGLRDEVWQKFYFLAIERPIFGYGERILIQVTLSDGEIITQAHNILFAAIIYGGIFAFISLFFYLLYSIGCAYKYMLLTQISIPLYSILYMIVAGAFDFEISSMEVNWQWIAFHLPISMSINCAYFINQKSNFKKMITQKMSSER
jgi:hypothetical protein